MFPTLTEPTVFLASPGDVAELRTAVGAEFDSIRSAVANDLGMKLFRYEIDRAKDGFDDAVPAQEQIYLPSDRNCKAVVCILGEKLGTPLGPDMPLGPIGNVHSAGGYYLQHPWVPGAEANGAFPLTGTVFEYLTSLHAKLDGKLLLLILGDETILTEDNPLNANWGFGQLENAAREKFGRRGQDFRDWTDVSYIPQLTQLRNFTRYLRARGYFIGNPNLIATEKDLRDKVRTFLERTLRYRRRISGRNPFKALEPYDVADMEVFFGRSEWRRAALDLWENLWRAETKRPIFGIVGASGTGKSSLLRAGMFAHLVDENTKGDYSGLVVRPEEIIPASGSSARDEQGPLAAGSPVRRLVARLAEGLGNSAHCKRALDEIEKRIRPEEQLGATVEALLSWLPRERRLIIGIDQFESLVDASVEPQTRASTSLLFQFLRLAIDTRRIGVIYTLQTTRLPLLEMDPILGDAFLLGETKLVPPLLEGLDELIRKPFELVGMVLEAALQRKLREKILEFAGESGRDTLLPLVSVTLSRLYETNRHRSDLGKQGSGMKSQSGRSSVDHLSDDQDAVLMLPLKGNEEHLSVGKAIAEFAEQAFQEVKKTAWFKVGEETIYSLLECLVRLPEGKSDRIDLLVAPLPQDPAVRRLADELRKRRLLLAEPDGRVRLVHEALLRHWPPAAVWLDEEVRILGFIQIALVRARNWDTEGRSAAALKGDVDEVAEILAKRWAMLTQRELGDEDRLLKDYGLALLAKYPDPLQEVTGRSKVVTHVYLAAMYGNVKLCEKYFEMHPECIAAKTPDGNSLLKAATWSGSIESVKLLIGLGASVDVSDAEGWMPIQHAAWLGNSTVLKLFVAAGANPKVVAANGSTLLHLASERGFDQTAAVLVDEYHCDPLEPDLRGRTPLHVAALNGHAAVVRFLLRTPACDVSAPEKEGWNCIHLAARYGHSVVLEELRKHSTFDPNRTLPAGWAPIHLSITGGNDRALVLLLEDARTNIAIRNSGVTVLHSAAEAGRLEMVNRILEKMVLDVNCADDTGNTALHYAAAYGHEGVVMRLLREPQLRPQIANKASDTPIGIAREKGKRGILELLVSDERVDPDLEEKGGWTPLLAAAEAGFGATVRQVLARATAISPKRAAAVLYYGAGSGDLALIRELIVDRGATPWVPTSRGTFPLHRAISNRYGDIVDLILSTPTTENLDTADIVSAAAIFADQTELLQKLLADQRLNPNARDGNGRTALMHSAIRGNISAFRLLVSDPRVNPWIKDPWSRTAVDFAPEKHRVEMEMLVEQRAS